MADGSACSASTSSPYLDYRLGALAGVLRGDARLRPDENGQAEFWVGETCFGIWDSRASNGVFSAEKCAHRAARRRRGGCANRVGDEGDEFAGPTMDSGVCHMAFFRDPDGNDLMLHSRYKPYE